MVRAGGARDPHAQALHFCRTSPTAVVLTVWPSGHSALPMARTFLKDCGAVIKYETELKLQPHAHILSVMALYTGEEWLESNCYYYEQPLPGGAPTGPFPGAQWKTALCFKSDAPLHVFVVDAANAPQLWQRKYAVRARMADATGNAGNSCIHLTDNQQRVIPHHRSGGGGALGCDDSYAFSCGRCLLHPASLHFLNEVGRRIDLADPSSVPEVQRFTDWLLDPAFVDFTQEGDAVLYQWPPHLQPPVPDALQSRDGE
eukprot:GGOE01006406.1.p1 GENE.GGOE01006406.1~~GGOE01006406.1.p1  ORF type:complete len:258 (-),score=64.46 GGOE01006406.1:259-1032(-)